MYQAYTTDIQEQHTPEEHNKNKRETFFRRTHEEYIKYKRSPQKGNKEKKKRGIN